MRQARRGLRLAQKAQPDFFAECELGWEHLDGDAALQSLVASVEDDAHPAPADFPFERIGAAERLGQAGRECLVCCVHPRSREVRADRLAAADRACNRQAALDLRRTPAPKRRYDVLASMAIRQRLPN